MKTAVTEFRHRFFHIYRGNKMNLYSNGGRHVRSGRSGFSKLRLVLTILIVVLILGLCALGWFLMNIFGAEEDFHQIAAQVQEHTPERSDVPISDTAKDELHETTENTANSEPSILPEYAQLYEQNADLFGWLRIDDTAINYPVMYTPDEPEKYLHINFEGKYSYPGVPFLDAGCTADSDNLLIYGHNIPNESMFRSLINYEDKNYWENHPIISFDTLYEHQEYEVLAAFYDRVYYTHETCFKFYQFIDAADEADFDNAIMQFKEKSLYDTGVDAQYGDQLITLVTCSYHTDNGRFVVVARRK